MNKKNIISLLILVAVVVIYMVSRNLEQTEKRYQFFQVDSTKVAKIQLKSYVDTTVVELKGDDWRMTHPKMVDASDEMVRKFFNKFLPLTVSELPIAEEPSMQNTYQVDSTGVSVSIYSADGKELDNVIYGKSARRNLGYIRRQDSNQIFLIDDLFQFVNPNHQLWRESKIVEIPKQNVKKIAVVHNDIGYEITQNDSGWVYTDETNELLVNPTARNLNKVLNLIEKMKSYVFFDNEYEKYKDDLASPEYQIMIEEVNGLSYMILAAKIDENSYVAQLDNKTDELYKMLPSQLKRFDIDSESINK